MSYPFQLKQVYSFSVHPVALLGNNFRNVKVLALLDAESASQLINIQEAHANMYPYLPAGTPNNPNSYNYLKIRTVSGEITVLGLAWINDETVTVVTNSTITVKIGGVTPEDAVRVREALVQNGFRTLEITVD